MKKSIKLLATIGTLSLLITSCNFITSCAKKPTYTITWKNADGSVLEIDEKVVKDTLPTYDGPTPSKEKDAQFSYVWTGWTPEVVEATADIEYVATYRSETNKYTVTWKNADDTVLKTEEVLYGVTPEYKGDTPTKDSTVEHTYTFEKWSPEIAPITQNTTYVASFKEEARKYNITWKDEDGTVLRTDEVAYGDTPSYGNDVPVKESTAQFSYVFANWSPNVTSVTGDATYVAAYNSEIRKYTVTWMNADGKVLEVDSNVPYGTVPTFDSGTPTRTDSRGAVEYTFSKWSPEVTEVTGDTTYTAEYTEVGVFSFAPINYQMQSGYKLSDINGAPWINSNVRGELDKIKKPSLKDDFYASVNYDGIKNWTKGAFENCSSKVNDIANQIFVGDTSSTTNGDTLKAACSYVYEGSLDQLNEYFDNFDIVTFLSSKNVFASKSSLLTICATDNGYEIGFNDGYLTGYYTSLPFAWVFDDTSEVAKTVVSILSNYMGLDFTADDINNIRSKEFDIFYEAYQDSFAYGNKTTPYTVSSIPWTPVKAALRDFGLSDNTAIFVKKTYRNALNILFNTMYTTTSGKNMLKKMVTSRLAFDFRFLMGGEAYKEVSRNLSGMGYWFGNEPYYYTYNVIDLCKEMVKSCFPYLYEQTYIELGSSDQIKAEVAELIDAVLDGYMDLADSSWLGDVTKQKMKAKLEKMYYVSCYSDFFRHYEKLEQEGINYQSIFDIFKLYLRAETDTLFNYSYRDAEPFSYYHSYTVNAFYSPNDNSFVILNGLASGLLGSSIEEKYGMLAVVIGHEITHAFDSSGAEYDENGDYKNWWTSEDKRTFNTKVQKLKDFYNNIALKKNYYVSGDVVDGEATADLGGMKVALMLASKINDFDYDAFFRAYAHLWMTYPMYLNEVNGRSEDAHPFNYLRVNVVVSQFDEFVETYDLKPGDGMYVPEEQRIKVW